MDFGLTQEMDIDLDAKSNKIVKLSNRLKDYFISKNYGRDVNHFLIGIICVRPEGEVFFKVRNPRYKAVDRVKLFDGNVTELIGVYGYDIKLNFEEFVSASETESEKILATEILNSLSNLDKLPKKVKDFDKEHFKSDMEQFFRERELL